MVYYGPSRGCHPCRNRRIKVRIAFVAACLSFNIHSLTMLLNRRENSATRQNRVVSDAPNQGGLVEDIASRRRYSLKNDPNSKQNPLNAVADLR